TVTARLGLSMGDGGQSRPGPAAPPIAVAVVPVASKGAGGRWLVLAAIIVIVILAGIALVIFFTSRGTPAKNSPAAVNKSGIPTVASPVATAGMKYGTAIQAATDAFARGDYDGAIRQSDIALECEPGDQAAMQIKADALKKKKDAASEASGYSGAMTAARNALAAGHYDEALRQVKNALIISPDDQAAMTLDATIAARQDADGRLRQDQYNAAMARGREALSNKNDSEASRQAGIALGLKPGDKDAKELVTQAQQDVVAQQAAPAPATRLSDGAATLKVNVASSSDGLQKNQQYQSEISAVQTAWNKNDFDTVIQNANLALQINPDAADLKSRLRDSVYNKLEIYAVWFGAIRPQDATFPLAKTQLPLAQGDMAPSAAIAYKNQIDYWVKLLNRYQLLDPVHTKLAGAIENNINRY
ncbi:MAG TPA: hypothetical protein VGV18_05820, partial [Verrucomicrobiae bacterium]|nr:hypothetical protein [Verrucomicrobiae bacterium]